MEVLPLVAQEPLFALKGGTAINLFGKDLPRLSIYIDLASQFAGMSDIPFSHDDHVATFEKLVTDIHAALSQTDRERLFGHEMHGGLDFVPQIGHFPPAFS